ncbi:MAG: hypothetical protein ACI9HK_002514, partial [Pirellulaceae bacterium]
QPLRAQPVPVQPLHAQPTPIQPLQPQRSQPAQPIPAQPIPVQPNPARPLPVNPAQQQVAPQPIPVQRQGVPQPIRPNGGPVPIPAHQGYGATGPVPIKAEAGNLTIREENYDDDEMNEKPPVALKQAPPWLISTIVHTVMIVVLGLCTFLLNSGKPPIELVSVIIAEEEGEQLEDDTFEALIPDPITDPEEAVFAEDLIPVEDPLAAPLDIQELVFDPTSSASDIPAPTVGLALSGREAGMKKALLSAYGGNATTEQAVTDGLEWLKRNQKTDGSWSLLGPYSYPAIGEENRSAATAMALLAYQGAGNTHLKGQFKTQVAKGWKFLLTQQDADGNFYHEGGHHDRLYTQAQCTIALCELYGMTKDSKFRAPAQKSLDYCHMAQSPVLGGWRYTPKEDSDMSVTGWFMMALQSGMMAGLEVSSPNLDKINTFLDSVTGDGGIHYGYKPGRGPTPTMTAEGLLSRQYLGWQHDDARLIEGVAYLNSNPIDYVGDENVYYWYYATQVTHHMGGDSWKRWNAVMKVEVPKHQVKSGAEKGSWDPSNDRWAASRGGRLFSTCLSVYMLEVYYRHLPIYKHQF